ncbi:hypothetical protein VPHK397_0174 [Vibrio phage K397]|nr:hypothetical protein MYOV002v2_p0164 [Vibrio phage 144E46.1]
MTHIERILATKPNHEERETVYATNIGWCIRQSFKPNDEECIYEFKGLLKALTEAGYDQYGVPSTDEPAGSPDTTGDAEDGTDTETDSDVDVGSTDTDESDGGNDDTDSDTDVDSGTDTGDITPTEEPQETEGGDTEIGSAGEETDSVGDDAGVKHTEESLNALPDMKALREVAKEFDVNDISKAKLIAKILEAQDAK